MLSWDTIRLFFQFNLMPEAKVSNNLQPNTKLVHMVQMSNLVTQKFAATKKCCW